MKTTELYFVLEALEWQLAQQQKEKEAAAARLRAGDSCLSEVEGLVEATSIMSRAGIRRQLT